MLSMFHIIAAATLSGAPNTADILGQAAGAAIQANVPRALQLIEDVDPSALAEKDRQFVLCMRERFGTAADQSKAEAGPMADRLLDTYRDYWRSAALRPTGREAEEKRLESRLRSLLGAPKSAGMDELEPLVAAALTKDGFHSLQGQTGLLRELMIWSREDSNLVTVALPEGPQRVKVVLLNEFKSMGWGYYAACGRRGAGGWATDKAIFAVVPRYASLDSEEYRVSFLGHEAQHFADKARFKGLEFVGTRVSGQADRAGYGRRHPAQDPEQVYRRPKRQSGVSAQLCQQAPARRSCTAAGPWKRERVVHHRHLPSAVRGGSRVAGG